MFGGGMNTQPAPPWSSATSTASTVAAATVFGITSVLLALGVEP